MSLPSGHDEADSSSEEKIDPLLARLQDKYTKQRSEQLAGKRKKLDKDLNSQALRNSALPPSIELLSDETALAFNDLETTLSSDPANRAALEQLRAIRVAVNREMRQALSCLEEGYVSGYHTLFSEAQLLRNKASIAAGAEGPKPVDGAQLSTEALSSTASVAAETGRSDVPPTSARKDGRRKATTEIDADQFPSEWHTVTRNAVAAEMRAQEDLRVDNLPRKLTVREALSSVTALFAESLAALLVCEVVRIYLYDENANLHCCARFPAVSTQGDPMRATYKELMLAKELHSAVCQKGVAINGSEPQYTVLGRRHMETVKEELRESGWDSMRSCLIFPILFHEGSPRADGNISRGRKAVGMIHAINKATVGDGTQGRFSGDDETLMSMASRLLGCMLTRYPTVLFTLRVGQAMRRLTHPNEGPEDPLGHLPVPLDEPVEEAALVGMQAMLAPQPIMILRAPISDVYQTRTQRARIRKLGNLIASDNALSSVEFNLNAVNELWETGMDDNVRMHQQFRALSEQMTKSKLLMRNLLDGLATTRAMRDPVEMAQYIKNLELFARSENTEMLSDYVGKALLERTKAASQRKASPGPEAREATPKPQEAAAAKTEEQPAAATASGEDQEECPYLEDDATITLMRRHERLRAKAAVHIHPEGPEGVRDYSSDPEKKREQVLFIAEAHRLRVEEQRRRLQAETQGTAGPHYLRSTACIPSVTQNRQEHMLRGAQRTMAASASKRKVQAQQATFGKSTDAAAAKRPYKL